MAATFAWKHRAVALTWAALAATLVPGAQAAGKANFLVNGDFSAGTVGWTGFTLSDGRPLLNLYVNASGELELLGRWDRCGLGDPSSCRQLPGAPLISQQVALSAGTYRFSWHQRNQAQGNWPTQGFDVRVLAPGEPLYATDPSTGYYTRVKPEKKAAIWVRNRATGLYGNAPERTYGVTFDAPVDGTYTIYLGLDNIGNSVDSSSGGYLYDRVWVSKLRLVRVCATGATC